MKVNIVLNKTTGFLSNFKKQETELLTVTEIDDVGLFLEYVLPYATSKNSMLGPASYRSKAIEIDGLLYVYNSHEYVITQGITTFVLTVKEKTKDVGLE